MPPATPAIAARAASAVAAGEGEREPGRGDEVSDVQRVAHVGVRAGGDQRRCLDAFAAGRHAEYPTAHARIASPANASGRPTAIENALGFPRTAKPTAGIAKQHSAPGEDDRFERRRFPVHREPGFARTAAATRSRASA
jgi:hypothetical protein